MYAIRSYYDAVLMVMKPEPGLQAKLDKQTKEELAVYKKSLTDEELNALVEDTSYNFV